jgi:hypothetical protein
VQGVLAAAQAAGTGMVRIVMFGGRPILPVLLAGGPRITDQDLIMVSHDELLSGDQYVPHPDLG